MGKGMKSILVELVPYAAMVMVQCALVGLTTIIKAAMSEGASPLILVVYSNAIASLILLPSSFFLNNFRRKSSDKRPPVVTFSFLCKVFLLSLVGITLMQNCTFAGVGFSSPTLATSISNLVPAFTFLLAVIFRMEKLELRSLKSQVKIMGTVVSIAGSFVITLYKGPPIVALLSVEPQPQLQLPTLVSPSASTSNWAVGGILLAVASLSIAVNNIFQAEILEAHPSEVNLVTFFSLFGTIQCAAVALIAERNLNAWKIRPDVELISVIYTALFGVVMTSAAVAWCISRKGPVFVAMFNPIGIFIAAFSSDIFLGDILHLGSVVGAIVIVVGFYGVMWAQSKEEGIGKANQGGKPKLSQETPFLEDDPLQV